VCVCVYGEFLFHQTSLMDSNLPTRLCPTMLSVSVSPVPHVHVYYLMSKKVQESLSTTKVVMIGVRMQAISFFLLQSFEENFFFGYWQRLLQISSYTQYCDKVAKTFFAWANVKSWSSQRLSGEKKLKHNWIMEKKANGVIRHECLEWCWWSNEPMWNCDQVKG
jgi:hypothetical protein